MQHIYGKNWSAAFLMLGFWGIFFLFLALIVWGSSADSRIGFAPSGFQVQRCADAILDEIYPGHGAVPLYQEFALQARAKLLEWTRLYLASSDIGEDDKTNLALRAAHECGFTEREMRVRRSVSR